VLVGRWEVMDRMHDGTWMRLGDAPYDAYVVDELNRAVDVLSAQGAAVVLSTAPYYHRGERPDGGTWPEDEPPRVDHFNALVRQVAAAHPGVVTLVDLGGRMTPNGKYQRVVDGVTVRNSDGVHVSPQGARWLAPWLLPQWRQAAAASPVP
jgi:lysophospholipase L1-like esterase